MIKVELGPFIGELGPVSPGSDQNVMSIYGMVDGRVENIYKKQTADYTEADAKRHLAKYLGGSIRIWIDTLEHWELL